LVVVAVLIVVIAAVVVMGEVDVGMNIAVVVVDA